MNCSNKTEKNTVGPRYFEVARELENKFEIGGFWNTTETGRAFIRLAAKRLFWPVMTNDFDHVISLCDVKT